MTDDKKLFEYTSGRWIFNDSQRRFRRKRPFNVPKLLQLAAKSVHRHIDEIASFEKLAEGGFNRSFLVTMQDGFKLVARVPYCSTEPRQMLVASEVATLDYLRLNGIPVPVVYGYCTTSENPTATEYIFLQFMQDINLGDVWFELPENARVKVIKNLVTLESQLFNLQFPVSGSLYYTHDLEPSTEIRTLNMTSRGELCIGPDTSLHLWYGKRLNLQCRRGPYCDSEAALTGGAEKEIAYLQAFGRALHPYNRTRRELYHYEKQDPGDHIANLQRYIQIARELMPKDNVLERPALRHPDLQPGNIFISKSLEIAGIIDWQHTVILPLFLQCGIPKIFQNYGDPVSESLTLPILPPNFDLMDEKEAYQEAVLLRKRQLHYYYLKETAMQNPVHQAALLSPMNTIIRKTFHHASDPWEGDNISLQADLVQLQQNWSKISQLACPLSWEQSKMQEIIQLDTAQREADDQLNICYEMLGLGPEGWVPAEHYDEAMQRAVTFKQDAFASEDDAEADALAKDHWIFDDFDEEEYE